MAWDLWVKDQTVQGAELLVAVSQQKCSSDDVATGTWWLVIWCCLPQGHKASEGKFRSVALWSRKWKSPRAARQLLG